MPRGIFTRTDAHKKACANNARKAHKLPRTEKQLDNARRMSTLPKTKTQQEASRKNIYKLHKLPRTKAQIENMRRIGKLPRTEIQYETNRENVKATQGLNCHHKNGKHEDGNQFNLQVLPHAEHLKIHGQLRNGINSGRSTNYSQVSLEVKLLTEMYYGD